VYTSAECFRHGKKKCFECSNDPELVGSDDEPPVLQPHHHHRCSRAYHHITDLLSTRQPPPSELATPLFRIVKEGVRRKNFYRPATYISHHGTLLVQELQVAMIEARL